MTQTEDIIPMPVNDLTTLDLLQEFNGVVALFGTRCESCRHLQLGGKTFCSKCLGDSVQFEPLSDTGRLYTWTTVHVGVQAPKTFGYIDLPEGVRLLTELDSVESHSIGTQLYLEINDTSWKFTTMKSQ